MKDYEVFNTATGETIFETNDREAARLRARERNTAIIYNSEAIKKYVADEWDKDSYLLASE